jgi:hypothetical protein
MKKFVIPFLVTLLVSPSLHAAQSTITQAEGYACMGYDKSRKVAEEEALANAKRAAAEFASTYVKSETQVVNALLEKDLIEAYAHASVKIIEELSRRWYKDPASGDCVQIRIKAEVIPDEHTMGRIGQSKGAEDDPSAPLKVRVWTDKKEPRQGEKIKVYLKGNKPFYARVIYQDAGGKLIQLLPNPYRAENYFQGGVVYEFPSGNDRFELEVTPPFGEENIHVYASSSPLGDLSLQKAGGVYEVKTEAKEVGKTTRGVQITQKKTGDEPGAAEFFEGMCAVKTRQ